MRLPLNTDILQNSTYYRLVFGFQPLSKVEGGSLIEVRLGKYGQGVGKGGDGDDNMVIVYFLLGVAGILLAVWLVLTIIRIKYG